MENISNMPLDGTRLLDGCSRNIDNEIKNIFSPITIRKSPYSNASSASYGTPEHTNGQQNGYYDSKHFSTSSYYHPDEDSNYSRSTEMLLARPNSSGPSLFMKEFGRDSR